MWRDTVFERLEKESELATRGISVDADRRKDAPLNVGIRDPNAAAAHLSTVDHDVVGPRTYGERIGFELADIVGVDHRERMVRGRDLTRLRAAREHGKLGHPDHVDAVSIVETARRAQMIAQRAERGGHRVRCVGDHEHAVAGVRSGGGADPVELLGGEEFRDRTLPSAGSLPEMRKSLRLGIAGDVGQAPFDVGARQVAATQDAYRLDDGTPGHRVGEDAEAGVPHRGGDVGELEREPRVRFVGSVATHRILPRDAWEWNGQRAASKVTRVPRGRDDLLQRCKHVLLVDERHLDVELRELRLTVCAQVLVTHAVRQLEITIEAGHHAQLLVELWRLRQRVEAAREQPARHQVVPCSFRRRPNHLRRLYLDETQPGEGAAELDAKRRARAQVALQPRPAQIQVTMAQAELLFHLAVFVHRERRCLRCRQHGARGSVQLHLAGLAFRVDVLRRSRAQLAVHTQHPLQANLVRVPQAARRLRIDDHLQGTGVVAQVDEDEPAVIAAPVDPTEDGHGPSRVAGAGGSAEGAGCAHARILIKRDTASVSSGDPTRCCACSNRSRTTTLPSRTSSSPTITAARAPRRSAARSLRSNRRSDTSSTTRTPAVLSSRANVAATCACGVSTEHTTASQSGSGPGAMPSRCATMRMRSAPSA